MKCFWKIMLILSKNYGGPPKPPEEAGWHNTEITTSQMTDCKSLMANTTVCTLPMLNHSVITQIHCPIIEYQQFRSWYWHHPGQFLCQLMVFKVPWKPLDNYCLRGWTQTEEKGKNKWVEHRRQKFRKQNWRYGQRNNHFILNANFRRLFFILFQGPSNFKGISRTFSGVSTISGFLQGFQRFQGSPATLHINHVTHPLSFADITIFYQKFTVFVISGGRDKLCLLMNNL